MTLAILEFLLLLAIIFVGVKKGGGIAIGLLGGLGVALYSFVFKMSAGSPPIDVMLIILCVVVTSSVLEVSGGLNVLVQLAEKLLRNNPKYVTILAPYTTFFLTMCVGTGHAVYPLYPVIADVAYKTGIRPERPLAVASIASQMGITASPIAAAVTSMVAMLVGKSDIAVSFMDILMLTIPSGITGVFVASLWSMNRGAELKDDPVYLERMKDPAIKASLEAGATTLDQAISGKAKLVLGLFLTAIATIIFLAMNPALLPLVKQKTMSMTLVLQLVMLSFGAIMLIITGIRPGQVANSEVFKAGMVAVISIMGIAWMGDTFIGANKPLLIDTLGGMISVAPWTFGIALFIASALINSQAAVLLVLVPLGLAVGVPVPVLLGLMPACYAYFVFCVYPSDLAAIGFDKTGTTKLGSWIFNHSFMMPGLIGVGTSATVAYFLATKVIF